MLRFSTEPMALVVHDDGTLTDDDRATLDAHLPGLRVIGRRQADDEVGVALRDAGLVRCAALRDRHAFALKLFDLRHYAIGRAVLYLDTDILIHRAPVELFAALNAPLDAWMDRYNEDIHTMYAWPEATLLAHTGVAVPPRFNAGLLCLRRERHEWDLLEHCLALPMTQEGAYYAEQTLNALDCARHGAAPLPPEYDVSFRHVWRAGDYARWLRHAPGGQEVVSQHYCGGMYRRLHFYRHFIRNVAGTLSGVPRPGAPTLPGTGQSVEDSSPLSLSTTRRMSSVS
jgi:hypothetical protein